jgi:hypothetical protein
LVFYMLPSPSSLRWREILKLYFKGRFKRTWWIQILVYLLISIPTHLKEHNYNSIILVRKYNHVSLLYQKCQVKYSRKQII